MLVLRTAGNKPNPWPDPCVHQSREQLYSYAICMLQKNESVFTFMKFSNSIQNVSKVFNVCHHSPTNFKMGNDILPTDFTLGERLPCLELPIQILKKITDQNRSYLFIYFGFIFVITSVLYINMPEDFRDIKRLKLIVFQKYREIK